MLLLVGCALANSACGSTPITEAEAPVERGAPVLFAFGSTQGEVVDHGSVRGRVTVVLFVATFDMASQAMARTLNDLLRSHRPRLNALAVVMEAPKYAVLAETFRTSQGLSYPVTLADAKTLAGGGAFGRIAAVPTTVVLDRDGRVVRRLQGLLMRHDLEEAVGAAGGGVRKGME